MYCPECGTEYQAGVEACVDCGVPLITDDEFETLDEEQERAEEEALKMELVEVCSVQGEPEAHIIRSMLAADGIDSMTRGDATALVHPLTLDGLGKIRIVVRESDAERARELIHGTDE